MKQPRDKILCQSCGEEFSGDTSGKCRCFEIKSDLNALTDLRGESKLFLFQDCLINKTDLSLAACHSAEKKELSFQFYRQAGIANLEEIFFRQTSETLKF